MSETDKQQKKQFDWLKEYQWQKGQSGNPAGRPKGKTMKEYAREFLANMSEEGRIEYFEGIDPDTVWKMAEGNPKQDTDITSGGKTIPIYGGITTIQGHNSDTKGVPNEKENPSGSGGNGGQ